MNQGFTIGWGNIQWGQVGIAGTMGAATSFLGGQLGNYLSKPISNLTSDIASPVLREAVTQGATNAASGFALSTGLALGSGSSLEEALKQGGQGALMGAGIGVMTGTAAGVKYARENNLNPWTGESNVKGNYSVYQGTDADGNTKYVGITERDPQIRFNEHHHSGTERAELKYEPVKSGLTKTQARIMEQNLINQYGMQKMGVLYIINAIPLLQNIGENTVLNIN